MIQKLSVILVKTLVFVKDGLIWAVKYIYILWIILTHVGEYSYCGRFFDLFKTKFDDTQKSNKV